MEFVEPIRNKQHIESIKTILKQQSYRNYLLFVVGINSGLRSVDLLQLKASDFINKDYLSLRERKTNKYKRMIINDALKSEVLQYIEYNNLDPDDHLFKSRKGINKPISRVQMYEIINNACRSIGLTDSFGNHTLRKTFGFHHYQKFKDVVMLQNIYNHSNPAITLRYIGHTNDMINESIKEFSL